MPDGYLGKSVPETGNSTNKKASVAHGEWVEEDEELAVYKVNQAKQKYLQLRNSPSAP